ncbi:MAG: ABC transporter permease [Clostridia bacterium]|nr:ABC transporter permease [Clostridia bacterium]
MKASDLFGHRPMFRSKKRKEGVLFTVPVILSMIVLGALIFCCVFAPFISPYTESGQDRTAIMQGPSMRHLLGTDRVGRDTLTRVFYGGRTTLISALGVVLISIIIGVPFGLISGYYGGWADTIIGRICDILLSFPSLLLAFIFVAGFGRSQLNAIIALGIVYVPMLTRLVRSLTLVEKNKTYVEALQSCGVSDFSIMFRHILRNSVSTITVQLTLDLGYAVLDLAALSFLGLGVQPPTADWGAMLEEGFTLILMQPMLSLAPGLAIVLTVIAVNIFSDGLHQYLEPIQRKMPSFKSVEARLERERSAQNECNA